MYKIIKWPAGWRVFFVFPPIFNFFTIIARRPSGRRGNPYSSASGLHSMNCFVTSFLAMTGDWNHFIELFVENVSKEANAMDLEEMARNDAMQNKNMCNDPKWSSQERQKYQAAYMNAREKMSEQN